MAPPGWEGWQRGEVWGRGDEVVKGMEIEDEAGYSEAPNGSFGIHKLTHSRARPTFRIPHCKFCGHLRGSYGLWAVGYEAIRL